MKTDEKRTAMTDVGARGGTRANRVVKTSINDDALADRKTFSSRYTVSSGERKHKQTKKSINHHHVDRRQAFTDGFRYEENDGRQGVR